LEVKLKSSHLLLLVDSLSGLHSLDISESLDFSEHVGSLRLDEVDVSLELRALASEINHMVALDVRLISEFAGFEEFLIKDSLGSHEFVLELHVLSLFLRHHVFEILNLLSAIGDLIHASVESSSALHLGSDFFFREEFISIFHGENLVVNTSVVSLLVLEIVELLSQLGDELVFVRASDFDSGRLL
jgi:hypothetical protein